MRSKHKAKPKPKRTAPDNRQRERPFQAYLSDAEWQKFERMAAAKGVSRTDLFRQWVNHEPAKKRTAVKKPRAAAAAPPPPDPRQIDITELEVFNAAVALTFAEDRAS